MILASALTTLVVTTAGTGTMDGAELYYLYRQAACDFAKRCNDAKAAERECGQPLQDSKKSWERAKARGPKGATTTVLERVDFEKCVKAAETAECTKYKLGWAAFSTDAANAACAEYIAYSKHTGKYAPKK